MTPEQKQKMQAGRKAATEAAKAAKASGHGPIKLTPASSGSAPVTATAQIRKGTPISAIQAVIEQQIATLPVGVQVFTAAGKIRLYS